MWRRFLSGIMLALLLSGCPGTNQPEVRRCPFVVSAEVAGVIVTSPGDETRTSKSGQQLVFTLPCEAQSFQLQKPCYASQQVVINPGDKSGHLLTKREWERFGYLRVENGSAHDPVEVRNLPGDSLVVAAKQHAARRLPLGEYQLEVTAPYKKPVTRDLRLCTEDDIFSLRVDTQGAEGDLVAESAQGITLEHGTGRLRVVTEVENLEFRVVPEDGALKDFLKKLDSPVSHVPLDKVPEGLRQAFAFFQRMNSESFRAPVAMALPAGQYRLSYSSHGALDVQVQPNEETLISLP